MSTEASRAEAFLELPRSRTRRTFLAETTRASALETSVEAAPGSLYPHIPILFETDRLLVINKPAGIPHHDDVLLRDGPSVDASNDDDFDKDDIGDETENFKKNSLTEDNQQQPQQLGILNLLRRQLALERGGGGGGGVDLATNDNPGGSLQLEGTVPAEKTVAATLLSSNSPSFALPARLYGVHRLDRVTSGILVFAKDVAMAGLLQRAFYRGSVTKYYVGLSTQKATLQKQGWVQGYMVRGRRKSWYLTRDDGKNTAKHERELQRGKQKNVPLASQGDEAYNGHESSRSEPRAFAKTRFFTAGLGHLQKSVSNMTTPSDPLLVPLSFPRTLILFRPYTGKTHQLRVAAKSVGIPLMGDPIYAGTAGAMKMNSDGAQSSDNRTYLHATAIHIPARALYDENCHEQDTIVADLTVWCPPASFEAAWPEEEQRHLFRIALDNLIRKHCDCKELLTTYNNSGSAGGGGDSIPNA